MKLALFYSGGGTKGIVQRGFSDEMSTTKVKPYVVGGVSIGAANAAIEAMGRQTQATKVFLNISDKVLWGPRRYKPQNIAGIYRGLSSIFKKRNPYLGIMHGYEKNLRRIIDPVTFQKYKSDPNSPDCYVMAARSDGTPSTWNIKLESYNMAIKMIMASGSIPLTTPPVEVYGQYFWDGGLISHSPGEHILPILEQKGTRPDTVATVFTRPGDAVMSQKDLTQVGLPEAFMQMIAIYNKNTTLEDEEDEREFCSKFGVDYYPVYTPYFSNGFYDVTKETAKRGYEIGRNSFRQQFFDKLKTIEQ